MWNFFAKSKVPEAPTELTYYNYRVVYKDGRPFDDIVASARRTDATWTWTTFDTSVNCWVCVKTKDIHKIIKTII